MNDHKNSASLLADARRSLLGNLGISVWSMLLFLAIQMFLNSLPGSFHFESTALSLLFTITAQFVTSVFASLFSVGLSAIFLNLQYGQTAGVGDLFICFRENQDTSIRVRGVVTIGELLILLPLQILLYYAPVREEPAFIPVIALLSVLSICVLLVWRISFAMANYLLLDFPEAGAGRILRASRVMMYGNRKRYLLLMLRLLPLYFLSLLSFGLTTFWVSSYQQAAAAAFYKDLLQGSEKKQVNPA